MQNYSIMPLDLDHIEEICQDIKYQYENGISSCALFSMTLTPEGNPAIDKAAILCEKYDKFRDRLAEMGFECGILVQATIGHGYKLNEEFAFQKYVNLRDGNSGFTCCPYDEGFKEYIKNAMKTVASHRPKVIMVDDDFRLMGRNGGGCACPIHLEKLSEKIGFSISREQLFEFTNKTDEKSLAITKAFIETQGESLLGSAKAMREGIDEVNPALPGIFCCCGNGAEFAGEIARILAGEGNEVTVRINNGNYTPAGARGQSYKAYRAAVQKIHMGDKVDTILAETDTCPQNRYSTSANSLHTHFVISILEGAAGAKHWITRLRDFEIESGKRYRATLAKYSGFYETLSGIIPSLSFIGANNFLSAVPSYGLGNEYDKTCYWANCVLERMGIPLYFSDKISNAVFLDGDDARNFTNEECLKILSGAAVLSSKSAKVFIERGFSEYLGVDIREWTGPNTSYEVILDIGKKTNAQREICEIVPLSDKCRVLSQVCHLKGGKEEVPLFPGSVSFKNSLGGNITVFAGTPKANFTYTEAFSFLNQSRKHQLVEILKESGNLPIYFQGDDEVYMKAAYTNDGDIFCAIVNTGFDEIEKITLCTEKTAKDVKILSPEGKWQSCKFAQNGENLVLDVPAYTLKPVAVLIK